MTRQEAIEILLKHSTMQLEQTGDTELVTAVTAIIDALQETSIISDALIMKTSEQIPSSCKNCSNHPSNGGSGICHCTLGTPKITC